MSEQFTAKATSIILASADEQDGFNVDMVKREAFHGRGDRDVVSCGRPCRDRFRGRAPDAVHAPPNWSSEEGHPPVLTSSEQLSTLPQRFGCARLSRPCLPFRRFRDLTIWLLTAAACGGLRLVPDCRTQRPSFISRYSCAPRIIVRRSWHTIQSCD
jgi:hypothetical protein